jgi:hypothetical protein
VVEVDGGVDPVEVRFFSFSASARASASSPAPPPPPQAVRVIREASEAHRTVRERVGFLVGMRQLAKGGEEGQRRSESEV